MQARRFKSSKSGWILGVALLAELMLCGLGTLWGEFGIWTGGVNTVGLVYVIWHLPGIRLLAIMEEIGPVSIHLPHWLELGFLLWVGAVQFSATIWLLRLVWNEPWRSRGSMRNEYS